MSALQHLPRDGKAITDAFAGREDEAFAEIASELATILADPNYSLALSVPTEWPPLDEQFVSVDRLPLTGHELFGRLPQLANLDLAWTSPNIHVMALFGRGGVGKTTLVGKWLERMKDDNYRGARRVFAWSFHDDAAGKLVASAHEFIVEALRWFGDLNPTTARRGPGRATCRAASAGQDAAGARRSRAAAGELGHERLYYRPRCLRCSWT